MSSNNQIQQQIETSAALTTKLGDLVQQLTKQATQAFEDATGAKLPSILTTLVRQIDTMMVYSEEANTTHLISSAQNLLTAALGADAPEIILSALTVVTDVVEKAIGKGKIEVGVHSSAANKKGIVTAVVSVTSVCSHEDWLTKKDFYIDQYIMCVFRPTPALTQILKPHLAATQ